MEETQITALQDQARTELREEELEQKIAALTETPAETEAAADAAARELERLTGEATQLEGKAEQAIAEFKRAPSAKTLTAKDVSAQVAINARAAVQSLAEATRAVRTAAQRIRDERELVQLRAAMNYDEITSTEIEQLTTDYLTAVKRVLAALNERVVTHNSHLVRRNSLELSIGDGRHRERLRIAEAMKSITDRAAPVFGANFSRQAIFSYFSGGTGDSRMEFILRFPPDMFSHQVR